jgi:preprotein translocase subunit YajC
MGTITAAAAATKSSSGNYTVFLFIIIAFGALYFLLIRPQRNRQRAAMSQQNTVTPGARVRTTAGMYATVVAVDDPDVILEVAPGVEVRYMRRAIMEVISEGPATEVPADDVEDELADDAENSEYDSHVSDAEDDDLTDIRDSVDTEEEEAAKAKTDSDVR